MEVLPLIAQEGVHHKVFGRKGTHNAMWDFALAPNGKIYFSLCSELIESSYARLYEYDTEKDSFDLLFRVEDVILPADRTIRPSKIHTCISFLPNGHLLMNTHTTDRSPEHPYWLPEAYYAHPWEGYAGSTLIDYDPVSRQARNLGVPVPFESIYGGVYLPQTNRYYFTGFFRGHLYSYDLATTRVKDYGQITEYGTFKLHPGPDGKLYWTTRSGYLCRLNVATDEIEMPDVRLSAGEDDLFAKKIRRLDYALNIDDHRMLLAAVSTDGLFLYDTATERLTNLGSYGTDQLVKDEKWQRAPIYAMSLDKDGVLWYALESKYSDGTASCALARWDVLHGGKPEVLGTLGSQKTNRIVCSVSEGFIREDVLFFADTNHANDMPGILSIDLAKFRPHMHETGGQSGDPFLEAREPQYREMLELTQSYGRFQQENPFMVQCDRWNAWKLWRLVPPEESRVQQLRVSDDGSLYGRCGGNGRTHFFQWDGATLALTQPTQAQCNALEDVPAHLGDHVPRLCVAGRQYKAIVTASAKLVDGSWLLGTRDGVLGLLQGDRVYRLGRAVANGPIHQLSANAAGTVVYGVGGDVSDLGTVFRYTPEAGVEDLGCLHFDLEQDPGIFCSCQPVCCHVSPNGNYVAIGTADRLGSVYLLHFENT